MANSAKQVALHRATLRTLNEARSAKTVRINPLQVVAEQHAPMDMNSGSVRAALQAASLIDNGGQMVANAIGTGSRSYSYNKGYYGKFEEPVIDYNDIVGQTAETAEDKAEEAYVEAQVTLNSDAPLLGAKKDHELVSKEELPSDSTDEEGGIKAIWSKYKTWIIILVIAVAAFVAYKKL